MGGTKPTYCLFTETAVSGRIKQRIGPTGLTLEQAYREAYAYNQAPYGSKEWSPFGWKIGLLPREETRRLVPASKRITTGICRSTGRVIPFGTQCKCGCRRFNRRFKKVGSKLVDVTHKKGGK